MTRHTLALAHALAETGHRFYSRGWTFGTSGNHSAVASRDPLELVITASGRDKRTPSASDVVLVDDQGQLAAKNSKPAAPRPIPCCT